MFELKRIPVESVPAALDKATRYRLLNEPHEAASICLDVLEVDADNQAALVTLLLALADQFGTDFNVALERSQTLLPRLHGEYERTYYEGIIHERWAKAQLDRGMPAEFAHAWFLKAMQCFERALALSPPNDPDAALRWNTCARFLAEHHETHHEIATVQADLSSSFGDDVPPR